MENYTITGVLTNTTYTPAEGTNSERMVAIVTYSYPKKDGTSEISNKRITFWDNKIINKIYNTPLNSLVSIGGSLRTRTYTQDNVVKAAMDVNGFSFTVLLKTQEIIDILNKPQQIQPAPQAAQPQMVAPATTAGPASLGGIPMVATAQPQMVAPAPQVAAIPAPVAQVAAGPAPVVAGSQWEVNL